MDIIDMAAERLKREEHVAGDARCLACKHEWAAVAPVGATWLECPECALQRGRLIGQYERDHPHWECACGCDLFCVTAAGTYCPNCGNWQDF